MRRILSIVSILILLLVSFTSSFVYAEDSQCNACTTTSSYIDNYISFAYEIISTLQTYANKEWSVFTTATNNLGNTAGSDQWTTTNDPLRWLEAIVDNLNKKAQSLASAGYVTSLITTEAVALDSWKSIGLLFQSTSLLRDWQKIDRVDQSVTNTLLDLGNAGVFIRLGFRPGLEERIKSILEKYSTGNNPIITIEPNAYSTQPMKLLWALRRINQNIKTIIVYGNISSTDEDGVKHYIIDHKYLNKQIGFSDQFKENIWWSPNIPWGYYSCARAINGIAACSQLWKQAKENMDAIRKSSKSQTEDAKKIIKNSIQRLSWFWAKNGGTKEQLAAKEALSQRERELLRWYYWWQWVQNSEWLPLVQGFWDAYKAVRNDITSIWWPIDGLSFKKQEAENPPFVVWDIASTIVSNNTKSNLINIALETTESANQARQQAIFSDSTPITKVFPSMTKELTKAQFTLAGNDPKAIVNNLWKACELQCSNVWWRCWYDQ